MKCARNCAHNLPTGCPQADCCEDFVPVEIEERLCTKCGFSKMYESPRGKKELYCRMGRRWCGTMLTCSSWMPRREE